MDLKDKMRKSNTQQPNLTVTAPFRASGTNKSAFIQPVQNPHFYNHQTPQSVKYQSQPDFVDETQVMQQVQYPQQNGYSLNPQDAQPQESYGMYQQPQQSGYYQQNPLDYPMPQQNSGTDEAFDEINSFLNANDTPQNGFVASPSIQEGLPYTNIPAQQYDTYSQPTEYQSSNAQSDNQTEDDLAKEFFSANESAKEEVQTEFFTPQNLFSDEQDDDAEDVSFDNDRTQKMIENAEIFKTFLTGLFDRYDIKKYLLVNDKIYTVVFEEDANDDEIYEEVVDKYLLNDFIDYFAKDGFYRTIVDIDKKIEVTTTPVSEVPIISVSKISFNYEIDDDFVRLLFEFINKGKNILILAPHSSEFMFKTVTDYLSRNLCVTVNEPIATSNNIPFHETKDIDSLKAILSIAEKVEPDNVLIYSPNNLAQSIKYMQKHKNCILFSETDTPSDFINSDAMSALNGFNEYNRILCLKSFDIVFSFTKTKNNTHRFTTTQLLSASNKSNINKIKKIIGEETPIDTDKIYFLNVFDKEL